ncbi:MAG: hypothetical protein WA709_05870 [Stellaceae bacterium]
MPQINNPDIVPRALPLAPAVEQEAIVELVEDQLSVVDYLQEDLDAKLKSAQGLRQAILRHAFTGQLVPQAPNETSAPELLKRIAAEREERARETAATRRTEKQSTKQRTGRKPHAPKHTRNRDH